MLARLICMVMDHAWRPTFDNGWSRYACVRCGRPANRVRDNRHPVVTR